MLSIPPSPSPATGKIHKAPWGRLFCDPQGCGARCLCSPQLRPAGPRPKTPKGFLHQATRWEELGPLRQQTRATAVSEKLATLKTRLAFLKNRAPNEKSQDFVEAGGLHKKYFFRPRATRNSSPTTARVPHPPGGWGHGHPPRHFPWGRSHSRWDTFLYSQVPPSSPHRAPQGLGATSGPTNQAKATLPGPDPRGCCFPPSGRNLRRALRRHQRSHSPCRQERGGSDSYPRHPFRRPGP